mgnify:CR=1 FL=1
MSLITRGFGASSSIITAGLGSSQLISSTVIPPLPRGRRSPAQKDELRKRIQEVDVYTISAKLMSINNKSLSQPIVERTRGAVDHSDEFHIKAKGKVRIIKTTPISNIFINVSNVFRKK